MLSENLFSPPKLKSPLKLKHNVKFHARHALGICTCPTAFKGSHFTFFEQSYPNGSRGRCKATHIQLFLSLFYYSTTLPLLEGNNYSQVLGHPLTHKVVERASTWGCMVPLLLLFLEGKGWKQVPLSIALPIQRQTKLMILCELRGATVLVNSNKPRRRGRRQRVHLDSSNQVVTGKTSNMLLALNLPTTRIILFIVLPAREPIPSSL